MVRKATRSAVPAATDGHKSLWGWRHNGQGFLIGIPACDIPADEAREHEGWATLLDNSPAYVRDYVETAEE